MPVDMEQNFRDARDGRTIREAAENYLRLRDAAQAKDRAENPPPDPAEAFGVNEAPAKTVPEQASERLGVAKDIAMDFGEGAFIESPVATARGAALGVNNTSKAMYDLTHWITEKSGLESGFSLNPEAGMTAKLKRGSGQLPDIEEGRELMPQLPVPPDTIDTNTGKAIEAIVQFGTVLYGLGKVLPGVQAATKFGRAATMTGRSAIAGTAAYDVFDDRFADFLAEVPFLQGPILDYMKSDEEESIAEKHLKMALEDAGFGIPMDALGTLFRALRVTKAAQIDRKAIEAGTAKPGAGVVGTELTPVNPEDIKALLNDIPEAPPMAAEPTMTPPKPPDMPKKGAESVRIEKPIRAWHGSPHPPFERFDYSKVGTGEGNTTYSHGLYFGEAEGVGEFYRHVLTEQADYVFIGNRKLTYSEIEATGGSAAPTMEWTSLAESGLTPSETRAQFQGWVGDLRQKLEIVKAESAKGEYYLVGDNPARFTVNRILNNDVGGGSAVIPGDKQSAIDYIRGQSEWHPDYKEKLIEILNTHEMRLDDTPFKLTIKEMEADLKLSQEILDAGGVTNPTGTVYEVNLHVSEDEVIDWFGLIDEQPTKVQKTAFELEVLRPEEMEPTDLLDWFIKTKYDAKVAAKTHSFAEEARANERLNEAFDVFSRGDPKEIKTWAENTTNHLNDRGLEGSYIPSWLEWKHGSEDAASLALSEMGIPGVRYMDANSRAIHNIGKVDATIEMGDTGERIVKVTDDNGLVEILGPFGTSEEAHQAAARARHPGRYEPVEGQPPPTNNLVIYDDTRIEIVSRNGEPVPPEEAKDIIEDILPPPGVGAKSVEWRDGKIYINWNHIESGRSVKAIMRDMADAQADDIDEARRGMQRWRDTKANASQVEAWDKMMDEADVKGVAWNDYETLALRQLWAESTNKIKTLAEAAENGGPTELFALRRQAAIHTILQKKAIGVRTEQARALQQWRIPVGGDHEVARAVNAIFEEWGGEEISREFARKISQLSRANEEGMLQEMLKGSIALKTRDALSSLWYAALLSGPHTHLRNMGSNTAVAIGQLGERKVAEMISFVRGGVDGVEAGEALEMFRADIETFKDLFRVMIRRQKLEDSVFRDVGEAWAGRTSTVRARTGRDPTGALSTETWNVDGHTPWGMVQDFVSGMVDIPTRALAAEDEGFKTFGRRRAFHYSARRQAVKQVRALDEAGREKLAMEIAKAVDPGRAEALAKEYMQSQDSLVVGRMNQLIADPTEAMRVEAEDYAAYVTFTNVPAAVPDNILKAWQKIPVFGRLTMPFRRTPTNLATYALERTPLAPMVKAWRDDMKKGGAARDLAMAKWFTGSGVMAAMLDLSAAGYILGPGTSPRERESNQAQGIQQNAVRLWVGPGMDDYYTLNYRGMEPVATTIGLAATITEIVREIDYDELDEEESIELGSIMVATTFAIMNQLTSQQYMQGIANFFEMMSDPTIKGMQFASRTVSSFVPNVLATKARLDDPYLRAAADMAEAFKRKIPGLSQKLAYSRDRWGHKRSRESGISPVYDVVSPIYAQKQHTAEIDRETDELEMYVGKPLKNAAFRTEWADMTLQRGSIKINLRNHPHEYDRYNELQGDELKLYSAGKFVNAVPMTQFEMLNALVDGTHAMSPVYQLLRSGFDGGRAQAIKSIREDYQMAAREQLLKEYPLLRDRVKREALKAQGAIK